MLNLIDKFLTDVKSQNSQNTFITYQTALKLLEVFLKKYDNNLKLTKAQAQDFRRYLLEKNLSKRSINNRLAAISSFYRWLIDNEHLEKNPFESKGLRLKVPQSLPKPLTMDQLNLILSKLEGQKRLAIFALASWGLRISELGNVKIGDISFGKFEIAKIRVLGKGEKERIVISCFKLFDKEIKEWITGKCEFSPLFDLKVDQIKSLCKRLSKRLGFKFSPHSFRHTYATYLAKRVKIQYVQKLMGHAKIETTMNYALVELPDIEKSIASIKNKLGLRIRYKQLEKRVGQHDRFLKKAKRMLGELNKNN